MSRLPRSARTLQVRWRWHYRSEGPVDDACAVGQNGETEGTGGRQVAGRRSTRYPRSQHPGRENSRSFLVRKNADERAYQPVRLVRYRIGRGDRGTPCRKNKQGQPHDPCDALRTLNAREQLDLESRKGSRNHLETKRSSTIDREGEK